LATLGFSLTCCACCCCRPDPHLTLLRLLLTRLGFQLGAAAPVAAGGLGLSLALLRLLLTHSSPGVGALGSHVPGLSLVCCAVAASHLLTLAALVLASLGLT